MTNLRLLEKHEGKVNVIGTFTFEGLLEHLRSTDYFSWILDEEPERELPTFENVETLRELESILKDYDYSYWSLEVESK